MNRTCSQSFRPFVPSPTENKMMKSALGFGFRTLWKDRDTHQLSTKKKSMRIVNHKNEEEKTNQALPLESPQQEIKHFIKMMKKSPDGTPQIPKPIELSKNEIKCQSSRSIHSSTRSICESRAFEVFETEPMLTLEELEKKIEEVIEIRLWKKKKSSKFFGSEIFEDDVDRELKNLMKQVRNYPQMNCSEEQKQMEDKECIDMSIKEISKKIGIIEKLMAEGYTESEMLKKCYSSSKLKSPKNHSQVHSNINLNKIPIKHSTFTSSMERPSSFINIQTTTMSSYGKPSAYSYSLEKYQRAPYLANRQPLTRSSYQREFLYYGVVPTYSSKFDNQNALTPNNLSMKNRLSNYQNEFKEKRVKLIDSQSLDCRLDKFRNLKINFMPVRHPSFNSEELKKTHKKEKMVNGSDCRLASQTNIKHEREEEGKKENILKMIKMLKSEQKENFTGRKCAIESYMKDKNLNSLKYSYKLSFKV